MTSYLFIVLTLIPLICMGLLAIVPRKRESLITVIATAGVWIDVLVYLYILYDWAKGGFVPIATQSSSFTLSPTYTFQLDWFMDTISAVFFGLTCIITLLIFSFSKYYMHRDPGFSRYFVTILLFFVGLTLVIFSGNFDVLFLGWEWIGISSFLLIGYYRDRFLPVRNALKVFSLYRIADVFMVIAIWVAHHTFLHAGGFSQFPEIVASMGNEFVLIGFLFLLIAMVKSAQVPFSYWLPRAMEGPTTSSAIFYGALSVHMGLFVLLRTYPLWEGSMALRVSIAVVGILTSLVASSITRVQSSIKTQISYASITQIGIMFVEIAVGFHELMLFHMVSNAFLRTYQLLISPSIAGYLVHDQFYYFVPPRTSIPDTFMGKVRATIFVLSIKEWNMNAIMTRYVWKPLKDIGRILSFLDAIPTSIITYLLVFVSVSVFALEVLRISDSLVGAYSTLGISILVFIRAYSTKHTPKICWNLIMLGHLFVMLFYSFATNNPWQYMFLYSIGIFVAFVAGHLSLGHLDSRDESMHLVDYHGHSYEYPRRAFVFFSICLGFMLFPITPSFLGQDIFLSTISVENAVLIALFGIAYLLTGISIMRLYSKIFLGPHKKRYHEIAHKSA